MKGVKFGVILSSRQIANGSWKVFKDLTLDCERLNFHSIYLGDHLMIGRHRLECWTTLSALSTITRKIRLGTMTLCNSYRHPSLVAKMAASLDVISEGRLEFGIGAGYYAQEYEAYGYLFPKLNVRIGQLEEGLEIIKRMWTEDQPTYKGKYYQIKKAICKPKPIQKPHPPITIGGGNEKHLLKVVAKYANRWDYPGSIKTHKHKLDVLESYCNEIGRDFQEIEKSKHFLCVGVYPSKNDLVKAMKGAYEKERKRLYLYDRSGHLLTFDNWLEETMTRSLLGTSEECISKLQKYIDMGVTYFILRFIDMAEWKESLKLFTERVLTNFSHA